MKTICSWRFFGVIIAGLIVSASSLRAQPVSEPPATDDDLATSDDEAAPTESVPASTGGVPAPTSGVPALTGDVPVPTGGGAIVLNAQNKPWNLGISMANRNAARALFLEGNRLFRIPLFAKAAEKYVAALGHWKHPAIYLNLALAQLNAGQEVEAYASLERALQHGEEPLGVENFQGARRQLEEVKRQLGRVRVTCRTVGAQVALDGVLLFIGPGTYEGWVKAKDHELTAKKPEYLSEARRVTIVPGQFQDIELKLVTLSEATDASRRWAVWKPWVVVATGGAVVAAGGAFHTLSFRNFREYDRGFHDLHCAKDMKPPGCQENGPELQQRPNLALRLKLASREWSVAVGSYIAGGSLVATGIVLLYLNRPRYVEQRSERLPGRIVTLFPIVTDGALGVSISMSH